MLFDKVIESNICHATTSKLKQESSRQTSHVVQANIKHAHVRRCTGDSRREM